MSTENILDLAICTPLDDDTDDSGFSDVNQVLA
jgi:hypothetical protein